MLFVAKLRQLDVRMAAARVAGVCFDRFTACKHVDNLIPWLVGNLPASTVHICCLCITCVSACAIAVPDDHTACEAARRKFLHISATTGNSTNPRWCKLPLSTCSDALIRASMNRVQKTTRRPQATRSKNVAGAQLHSKATKVAALQNMTRRSHRLLCCGTVLAPRHPSCRGAPRTVEGTLRRHAPAILTKTLNPPHQICRVCRDSRA